MNDLDKIAQSLKLAAEATTEPVQHSLERGLTLTLQKHADSYTLSLTRKGAKPSQAEEGICRRAFKVPTQGIVRYEFVRGPYSVIRLMWKETEQTGIAQCSTSTQTANS